MSIGDSGKGPRKGFISNICSGGNYLKVAQSDIAGLTRDSMKFGES